MSIRIRTLDSPGDPTLYQLAASIERLADGFFYDSVLGKFAARPVANPYVPLVMFGPKWTLAERVYGVNLATGTSFADGGYFWTTWMIPVPGSTVWPQDIGVRDCGYIEVKGGTDNWLPA